MKKKTIIAAVILACIGLIVLLYIGVPALNRRWILSAAEAQWGVTIKGKVIDYERATLGPRGEGITYFLINSDGQQDIAWETAETAPLAIMQSELKRVLTEAESLTYLSEDIPFRDDCRYAYEKNTQGDQFFLVYDPQTNYLHMLSYTF